MVLPWVGNIADVTLTTAATMILGQSSRREAAQVRAFQKEMYRATDTFWQCIDKQTAEGRSRSLAGRAAVPYSDDEEAERVKELKKGVLVCCEQFVPALKQGDRLVTRLTDSNTLYSRVVTPPITRIMDRQRGMFYNVLRHLRGE